MGRSYLHHGHRSAVLIKPRSARYQMVKPITAATTACASAELAWQSCLCRSPVGEGTLEFVEIPQGRRKIRSVGVPDFSARDQGRANRDRHGGAIELARVESVQSRSVRRRVLAIRRRESRSMRITGGSAAAACRLAARVNRDWVTTAARCESWN